MEATVSLCLPTSSVSRLLCLDEARLKTVVLSLKRQDRLWFRATCWSQGAASPNPSLAIFWLCDLRPVTLTSVCFGSLNC